MCFRIKEHAERRRSRTGWKVVVLQKGYLKSITRPTYYWSPGVKIARGPGPYIRQSRFTGCHQAQKGIYVFTRKQRALDEARWGDNLVVLRVEVNPDDWIATSENGQVATYKKVFVPEEQPFLEWY